MRLDCGKCVVRDWSRPDKASLLLHANNRNVARNLTERFPHPYTDADAENWFSMLEGMTEPTHWAIDMDGHAVGGIGCIVGKGIRAKSAAFGYWLGEKFWGRGIVSAAVQRVAPYVLEHFKVVRLESPVFAWNPASMRVLEKAGFTREAVHRSAVLKEGQLIDEVLYALVDTSRR